MYKYTSFCSLTAKDSNATKETRAHLFIAKELFDNLSIILIMNSKCFILFSMLKITHTIVDYKLFS